MEKINPDMVTWINSVMLHRENCTAEELFEYFINSGLTENFARYIVNHKEDYSIV